MIQSLSYTEMNHAVPGSSFSPRMDRYYECEVPSPSQWSDPCRSPPSLHSPVHFPADLEKLKEEPFSPSSAACHLSFLPLHRPMSREERESSFSLAELLEENAALVKHVEHQQYQHHQQQQQQHQQHHTSGLKSDGDLFGEDYLDQFVKKEIVDSESSVYLVSSSSSSGVGGSSSLPPISPVVQPQTPVGDCLRTVELMALDHCRQYVERVSYKLNIPKDPIAWSSSDVRSWLEYEAEQQGLPSPSLGSWNWTGLDLTRLKEAQFRELIPHGGELLYAKLEIWREAFRTSYQPESSLRSPNISMPLHSQYLQPAVTQAPPTTQPLTVNVPQYHHHHVPQLYQSPSSSSSFSPPGMMISPVPPPPLIMMSPSLSPRQPSHMPPSPSLQVPTPVIQVERQQQHHQMHQQQKQQEQEHPAPQQQLQDQLKNAPKSPQKHSLSPSPSASCSRSQSPSQLIRSTFMEKCIDVTTLLKPIPETPDTQTQVETTQEAIESEDEGEKESSTSTGNRGGTHIHLWQFLKELLLHPQLYGSCIRWLDRSKGVFKIEDSVRVARLWGKRKNRPAMNYDKLSRSIRQYYKKNIMKKTERSQRLVYQFCHPYGL